MKLFYRLYSMKRAVTVFLILSLCTNYIYGDINSIVNSKPDEVLKYLLARLESNSDQFHSGKGKVSWEITGITGNYFDVPAGTKKQMSIDFAFSEDKLRWDTYVKYFNENDQLKSHLYRGVVNYPVEYEAEMFIDSTKNDIKNVHELRPTDLYIWKSGESKSSTYSGGRVDLKYMMQPFGLPLEAIRQVLFEGDKSEIEIQVLDVSSDSDNLIAVKLEIRNENSAIEEHLTFDVSKGYNIVKEAVFLEGKLGSQVIRTFRPYGEDWFLDSLEHTLYHLSVGTTPTGKAVFQVREFEPNKSIPESTFEIRGMGLAKHVEVHDMVVGVKYKPNVEELLEESVEKILDIIQNQYNNYDVRSESEKQKLLTGTPHESPLAGQEQKDQKESIEKESDLKFKLVIPFAILAVAILILILLLRKPFHKR